MKKKKRTEVAEEERQRIGWRKHWERMSREKERKRISGREKEECVERRNEKKWVERKTKKENVNRRKKNELGGEVRKIVTNWKEKKKSLAHLTWMIMWWEVSGHTSAVLWLATSKIYSKQHAESSCSSYQTFFSQHFV